MHPDPSSDSKDIMHPVEAPSKTTDENENTVQNSKEPTANEATAKKEDVKSKEETEDLDELVKEKIDEIIDTVERKETDKGEDDNGDTGQVTAAEAEGEDAQKQEEPKEEEINEANEKEESEDYETDDDEEEDEEASTTIATDAEDSRLDEEEEEPFWEDEDAEVPNLEEDESSMNISFSEVAGMFRALAENSVSAVSNKPPKKKRRQSYEESETSESDSDSSEFKSCQSEVSFETFTPKKPTKKPVAPKKPAVARPPPREGSRKSSRSAAKDAVAKIKSFVTIDMQGISETADDFIDAWEEPMKEDGDGENEQEMATEKEMDHASGSAKKVADKVMDEDLAMEQELEDANRRLEEVDKVLNELVKEKDTTKIDENKDTVERKDTSKKDVLKVKIMSPLLQRKRKKASPLRTPLNSPGSCITKDCFRTPSPNITTSPRISQDEDLASPAKKRTRSGRNQKQKSDLTQAKKDVSDTEDQNRNADGENEKRSPVRNTVPSLMSKAKAAIEAARKQGKSPRFASPSERPTCLRSPRTPRQVSRQELGSPEGRKLKEKEYKSPKYPNKLPRLDAASPPRLLVTDPMLSPAQLIQMALLRKRQQATKAEQEEPQNKEAENDVAIKAEKNIKKKKVPGAKKVQKSKTRVTAAKTVQEVDEDSAKKDKQMTKTSEEAVSKINVRGKGAETSAANQKEPGRKTRNAKTTGNAVNESEKDVENDDDFHKLNLEYETTLAGEIKKDVTNKKGRKKTHEAVKEPKKDDVKKVDVDSLEKDKKNVGMDDSNTTRKTRRRGKVEDVTVVHAESKEEIDRKDKQAGNDMEDEDTNASRKTRGRGKAAEVTVVHGENQEEINVKHTQTKDDKEDEVKSEAVQRNVKRGKRRLPADKSNDKTKPKETHIEPNDMKETNSDVNDVERESVHKDGAKTKKAKGTKKTGEKSSEEEMKTADENSTRKNEIEEQCEPVVEDRRPTRRRNRNSITEKLLHEEESLKSKLDASQEKAEGKTCNESSKENIELRDTIKTKKGKGKKTGKKQADEVESLKTSVESSQEKVDSRDRTRATRLRGPKTDCNEKQTSDIEPQTTGDDSSQAKVELRATRGRGQKTDCNEKQTSDIEPQTTGGDSNQEKVDSRDRTRATRGKGKQTEHTEEKSVTDESTKKKIATSAKTEPEKTRENSTRSQPVKSHTSTENSPSDENSTTAALASTSSTNTTISSPKTRKKSREQLKEGPIKSHTSPENSPSDENSTTAALASPSSATTLGIDAICSPKTRKKSREKLKEGPVIVKSDLVIDSEATICSPKTRKKSKEKLQEGPVIVKSDLVIDSEATICSPTTRKKSREMLQEGPTIEKSDLVMDSEATICSPKTRKKSREQLREGPVIEKSDLVIDSEAIICSPKTRKKSKETLTKGPTIEKSNLVMDSEATIGSPKTRKQSREQLKEGPVIEKSDLVMDSEATHIGHRLIIGKVISPISSSKLSKCTASTEGEGEREERSGERKQRAKKKKGKTKGR